MGPEASIGAAYTWIRYIKNPDAEEFADRHVDRSTAIGYVQQLAAIIESTHKQPQMAENVRRGLQDVLNRV